MAIAYQDKQMLKNAWISISISNKPNNITSK